MSTVASLQIKIGADVSAAINGLSRAEFAADQVKEAYIAANNTTVQGGAAIAVWAQNFSTAATAVQRNINDINTDSLSKESKESVDDMKKMVDGAVKVGNQVTVMAAAFSGAQAIAGPALAGIARLIPSIGASLAALAGPIGLAIGLAAALGAGYLANAGAIKQVISEEQKLNQQITQEIASAGVLFGVLKQGNLTSEKRASLIEDINKKYDTTLKNLKSETEFVAQVDVAYQKLSESIKNKILLAGAQKELEGLIAQQIQTEKNKDGLIAAQKAVVGLNSELQKIGATPSQQFDPTTFFGGTKGITDANDKIAGQQIDINKKLAEMAALYNKIFEGSGSGSSGAESEASKTKDAIEELGKALEIIQVKNKEGLLPDKQVVDSQIDAISSALSKLADINVNGDAFKGISNDFKALFPKESFKIPIVPSIQINETESLTPVAPLADRMKAAVEEKLSKIRLVIDDTGAIAAAQSFADKYKNIINGISNAANIASQVGNALFGAINQSGANDLERRSQALDAYYEKEQSLIASSLGSETLKNRKKEQLDKEVAAKRKQIAKEEAQAQKRLNFFEALINTANAFTRALAVGGPILAAAVGALGAAEIAAIASAPIPALAGGALVTGPSFVQVGEYPGASNNPELITPVDRAQKYIREAINDAGGGSQELYSFISNDDIMLATKRGEYRSKRFQ